jgi:hypothetical protein
MEDKAQAEQNFIDKARKEARTARDNITEIIFNRKPNIDPRIALPDIQLKASAKISDLDRWEAVERFPACLLITDPILYNETENYTVNEIVFDIKSNDQGWCNEDNFEGAPHSVSGCISILSIM